MRVRIVNVVSISLISIFWILNAEFRELPHMRVQAEVARQAKIAQDFRDLALNQVDLIPQYIDFVRGIRVSLCSLVAEELRLPCIVEYVHAQLLYERANRMAHSSLASLNEGDLHGAIENIKQVNVLVKEGNLYLEYIQRDIIPRAQ
ncbi:MAG TPA: hypothetical protein VN495_04235 [Candidatus Paceibacterota bacterium]|nr:hypothetical protein [Candidatus Paceibacterota bacterium]